MSRVAAIVPARNEAERIGATVRALRALEEIDEVIVVEDGSTDDTAAIAAREGARVVRLDPRAGKGGALRAGVARTDAAVLCFVDGDLGESARVAAALLAPVLAGDADMAIACPPRGGPSGFGFVERLSRWGIRRLAGARMSRPLSGQRALRRALLTRCRLAGRFGVETALTIDALRAGFRVVEVPADVTHRRTGRDLAGFTHRARQGFDVAWVLARRFRAGGTGGDKKETR